MHKTPSISIIMCTHNDGLFIAEAIQSILDQTFTDYEFIIINDGSTDNTKLVIQSFNCPKIKYFEHPINKGQEDAKNLGISKATCEYIAYMDGDDISDPNRLQVQYDFMEKNSDIGVCSTGVRFFGNKEGEYFGAEKHDGIKLKGLFSTSITHATCLIRRSILEQNNLRYEQGYQAAEDFYFLSILLDKAKAYCIQKPLYFYRWHGNNISIKQGDLQLQNFYRISFHNFKTWLSMSNLTINDHKIICAFFRGPNDLTTLPIMDKLIKRNLDVKKTGDFGRTFNKYYHEKVLEIYVQESGKGMKALWAFLKDDVWRKLPMHHFFLTYALIITRSIYRSIIHDSRV